MMVNCIRSNIPDINFNNVFVETGDTVTSSFFHTEKVPVLEICIPPNHRIAKAMLADFVSTPWTKYLAIAHLL